MRIDRNWSNTMLGTQRVWTVRRFVNRHLLSWRPIRNKLLSHRSAVATTSGKAPSDHAAIAFHCGKSLRRGVDVLHAPCELQPDGYAEEPGGSTRVYGPLQCGAVASGRTSS